MRVLYDHQIFDMQRVGGISRYFTELLKNMPTDVHSEVTVKYTVNEYLKEVSSLASQIIPPPDFFLEFMGGATFRGKRKLYNLKNRLFPEPDLADYNKQLTISALKKGDFDIFHPTYYDDYFLKYIGNKPYILTVYDMIHEIYSEDFLYNSNNSIISAKKRQLIKGAAKILAISANTSKDLLALSEVSPEKVTVTHLGNSLLNTVCKPVAGVPEKYLLFVGGRENYKNFYFFLYAVRSLLIKDPDLHIICTGSKFNQTEKELLKTLDLDTHVQHYYVDDNQLIYLYQHALAFVFPSLYEGFGLPVLEAFACKCPVLLSNSSSLIEVGGEAAIYFEPKDTNSIQNAVSKVLYEPSVRQQMIALGTEQLKKFSWQKTAYLTFQAYSSIIH